MNHYRALIFMLLVFASVIMGCQPTKQIVVDSPESRTNALDLFALDVYKLIIENKKSILDAHLPTIDIVRQMLMSEAEDKSDEEIEEMILGLKEKLLQNSEKIRNDIKNSGFSLKSSIYFGFIPYPEEANGSVEVMSIKIKNGNNVGLIPITFDLEHDSVYLLEILMTTNIIKTN